MQSKFNIIVLVIAIITLSSYTSNHKDIVVDKGGKKILIGQGTPEELVGKWVMDGDPNTFIELKQDGTVIEKSLGEPLERFWGLKEEKLCLKANSEENATEICLDYVLNGNVLVITMNKMELYYVKSNKINKP
ncbi:hypothetical protein [Aquimarina sp. I32.4]|uniref:hypothetical protein n=1 Tax=Aquimarina sp. I32.4 TaxID=2053903 RepID=UPI000CDED175|nr:hypothetical protein [Aquimarina sp. I32.4]